MAYSPQNVNIYLAAFAGALAGMQCSNRVPTNTASSSYTAAMTVIGAFAQSYDTQWGNRATTLLDVQATQDACESVWQNRAPQPNATTTTPATYTTEVSAIIAMITAAEAYLAGQGITPPDEPASGKQITGLITFSGTLQVPAGASQLYYLSNSGIADAGTDPVNYSVGDGEEFPTYYTRFTAVNMCCQVQEAIPADDILAFSFYSDGVGHGLDPVFTNTGAETGTQKGKAFALDILNSFDIGVTYTKGAGPKIYHVSATLGVRATTAFTPTS